LTRVASRTGPDALLADPVRGSSLPPAVHLAGVTRVFGVSPGLVRAELSIERGEVVLVRGPNGAGKSTLLRVMATALSPTYGSGTVLGFDLLAGRAEIRRRTELLGHRTRLYEDLTARENLAFACLLYGLDPTGIDGALGTVGLSAEAGDRVRGFSQGMRQRVAVARAILRRPELLLLDEPYAGLDAESKDVVDGAVLAARADGRTVVMATHDPTRGSMASHFVRMEGGRVLEGSP
jgi:ABC-type multidrug transport system ATPase subunit